MSAVPKQPERPAGAPVVQIMNVSLEPIEAAVYAHRREEAAQAILQAFARLRNGGLYGYESTASEAQGALNARMASAFTALLCDPEFTFSEDGYTRFAIHHAVIAAIFEVSAFGSADHLARILAKNPAERDPAKFQYGPVELAKWLLTYGLNSRIDVDFEHLYQTGKQVLLPLWAACLAGLVVVTELAEARREKLLKLGPIFEDVSVPDAALGPLSDAYMYSSYATSPDRHEVKRSIAKMLANTIRMRCELPSVETIAERREAAFEHAPRAKNGKNRLTRRPTMLVPLEWWSSWHAMYRCYAPIMDQLRERFRLVGFARSSAVDKQARASFDDFMPVPEGDVSLQTLVGSVSSIAPDVIYYPSVGMSAWWVSLAQARLAPIQAMTLGHPASSFSAAMDYLAIEENHLSDPGLFSERLLVVPDGAGAFDMRPDMKEAVAAARAVREARPKDGIVRIAVPAMSCKLAWPFIKMLQRIGIDARSAGVEVEFRFFPNQMGVMIEQLRVHLRRELAGFRFDAYPRSEYRQYMEWMALCEFAVTTIPFGGTNSTVDALMAGVPMLSPMGAQPHERFDGAILQRCGLGEFVSADHESYERDVLAMAVNPDRVKAFEAKIGTAEEIESKLYGKLEGPAAGAFGRAFWHAFKHHERIVESGAKVIHWREFS